MNPLHTTGTRCGHPRYTLDADDRSVNCSTCGVVVDAFDVLLDEAEKYARQDGYLAKARGEYARLQSEIADQRKTLATLRKSADRKNRELNRLIVKCKELTAKIEDATPHEDPSSAFDVSEAAESALSAFKERGR